MGKRDVDIIGVVLDRRQEERTVHVSTGALYMGDKTPCRPTGRRNSAVDLEGIHGTTDINEKEDEGVWKYCFKSECL